MSFTLSYVALALILSTTISLFWLVALLAAHMMLEWIALVRRGDRCYTLTKIVWHVKLDIALVLFALALGLYFDVLFGLLGVGALARSGAQVTARFVAWQRGMRTVLLAADDVALVAKAAAHRLRGAAMPVRPGEPEPAAVGGSRTGRWSRADVAPPAKVLRHGDGPSRRAVPPTTGRWQGRGSRVGIGGNRGT